MSTLTFHGAARTVTGSKHLLQVDGRRILIDCEQFQGRKDLRLLNWTQFPFDPKELDAVILTSTHLRL
jgi:metallo-beta-lactamase family protein